MRVTVGLERMSSCPHAYELSASVDAPTQERASGAAYLGSCVHKALETYFREKQEIGSGSLTTALEAYEAAWVSGEALPPGFTFEQVTWTQKGFETHDAAQTYADGVVLISKYVEELGYRLRPVLIEESFDIDVGGHLIHGTIDNVSEVEGQQGLVLIDYKTGSRAKTGVQAHTSIQLSSYAWALRKMGVWSDRDERVEYHCLNRYKPVWKNGKPSPKPYAINVVKTRRNLLNYEWMDEVFIPRIIAQERSGAFPANPGQHCFTCSVRQLCGHWESIQEVLAALEFERNETEAEMLGEGEDND